MTSYCPNLCWRRSLAYWWLHTKNSIQSSIHHAKHTCNLYTLRMRIAISYPCMSHQQKCGRYAKSPGPRLLTWNIFISSMDKYLHAHNRMRWNFLSISKLQRLKHLNLWIHNYFHRTLNGAYDYISMQGFKLKHVRKWKRIIEVRCKHHI